MKRMPQVVPRLEVSEPRTTLRFGRRVTAEEDFVLPSRSSSTREQTCKKSLGSSVMTPSMRTGFGVVVESILGSSEREEAEDEAEVDRREGVLGMFLRMHHSIHLGLLTVHAKTGREADLAFERNQPPRGPTRRSWNMLKPRLGMGRKWRE